MSDGHVQLTEGAEGGGQEPRAGGETQLRQRDAVSDGHVQLTEGAEGGGRSGAESRRRDPAPTERRRE